MKKPSARKQPISSLRRKAEKMLKQQTDRLRDLSKNDMKQLIHELGTHQIELEMQNEELRRAQVEIEASRRKYAELYDFAPVGYFTFDKDGLILETNLAGANMLGVNKRLLVNKPFARFTESFKDRTAFTDHLAAVLQKQMRETCELMLRGKDGDFFAQLQSIPGEDSEGNPSLIRTALSDITERRRTAKALEQAYDTLHATLESITDGFFSFDREWRFTYVNETASKLLRKKKEELMGHTVWDIFPEARHLLFYTESNRAISENTPVHFEEFYPDPLNTWYECHCFPSRDGLSVYFRDITERKKTEDALKQAHAELGRRAYELEAVNRDLDAFSFTVSNDLKAPLRSIEGFTKALLEDYSERLDETGRDYLTRAYSASKRMSQLIEAMLTVSRLTKGVLRERDVNLSDKVRVIAHELKKRDPQRNVEFVIAEKVKAKGDDAMLQIVLENLLDNAWKFTGKHPSAKIEFGVAQKDGSNVYFVRDDGAGFDMQYADKLFMPFKRLHMASEFPGLGIGLAMVQRIINRHGGKIWAEGEVDKGATFYFTLG